jgi:hypothetical protein
MVIRAWWPLFGLLVLTGAGITGLFVEHPEPHNRSQPTVTPYQNSHSDELAATHSSNQHGQKGEQERSWIEGLFDKPTDTLLVCFNGLLVLFTYFLYSATSGLFKETAELRRIADEQRVDLSRSIAAAEQSATAAMKSARVSEIALESAETPYLYPTVMTACKHGELLLFSYAFENFGRSPAIVREIYDGSILSSGLPAAIGFPPPQSNLGKSHVVAVGKHSPDRKMAISFPIGEGQNAAVWLMGQVRYSDVFGNQFLSGFCFALNSASGAFTTYGGAGYNYRRKLTDQERQIAETRDADPLVAVAP